MGASSNLLTSYLSPEVIDFPGMWLVSEGAAGPEDAFLFFDPLEIGRFHEKRRLPGMVLVHDQMVSSRHCVITQDSDGRCYVRDTSRNGTRVVGRRLTPKLQTEIELGQVLSIGRRLKPRLDGTPSSLLAAESFDSDITHLGDSLHEPWNICFLAASFSTRGFSAVAAASLFDGCVVEMMKLNESLECRCSSPQS